MSSLAGLQGTPSLATKAFGAVLAEGLWAELCGSGVDVLACVAGAVATPGGSTPP
jgi:short-subunit dehydrogenase